MFGGSVLSSHIRNQGESNNEKMPEQLVTETQFSKVYKCPNPNGLRFR